MSKTILHLCADIGSDSQPYRDNGYNVVCIGKNVGVENFIPSDPIHGIIANPVCTNFSIANGFHKNRSTEEDFKMVVECQRIIDQAKPNWWVIENPASGTLKNYLGTPKFIYEPWWYGDGWTKKTALWGKFNIPPRIYYRWEDCPKIEGLYQRPGRPKPSIAFNHKNHKRFIKSFDCFKADTDPDFRSLCPQGFAQAFFLANQ